MKIGPRIVFVAGALVLAGGALAEVFTRVERVPEEVESRRAYVRADGGALFRIDWSGLEAALAGAARPMGERTALDEQAVIELPTPDGSVRRFRVVESPMMEAEVAAAFPMIRTYRVRGVDDAATVGRLDVTSHGLRGMIRVPGGTYFIDPYSGGERGYVSVYDLGRVAGGHDWACHVGAEHGDGDWPVPEVGADEVVSPAGQSDGLPLRAYRMAMACTGEYGAYQSEVLGNAPNAVDAFSALVTIVNRCNLVFEIDAGVRFVMVAGSEQLAFFDPEADPYPAPNADCITNPAADCSSPYLSANISAVNSIIGSANYDIGHLMTRVRGGVAYLRSACTNNKAGGISGIPRGGEMEPVSALVALHELGHQYGARHTFNGVLGRCNANINGTTNWEPGGGSTLMAYPGACPVGGAIGGDGGEETDNLVQFADAYFHTGSIMEMRSFLEGGTSQCSTTIPVSNQGEPVITSIMPTGLAIPPMTPFVLSVAATDDGPGLTYQWDQLDVGPAQQLTGPTSADNGLSALFRSWAATGEPTRTIPRMSDLLAGVPYIGERMPSFVGATRKFRVTIRDGQGATRVSSRRDVVIADTQPFVVNGPSAGARVRGPLLGVEWNAGAIGGPPIGVSSVRITLSLDGGQTFPHVLAESAPNTGSAVFDAGELAGATARVRVEAVGNIFFNLSGPFELLPPCPADFNSDGTLDPDDLGDFINCYFATPPCAGADFNGDGSLDPDDLGDFINAYFAGCEG